MSEPSNIHTQETPEYLQQVLTGLIRGKSISVEDAKLFMGSPDFVRQHPGLMNLLSDRYPKAFNKYITPQLNQSNPNILDQSAEQSPPYPPYYTVTTPEGANTRYPTTIPDQTDPNWAFMRDRNNFESNWHRVGDPLEGSFSQQTINQLKENQSYPQYTGNILPEYHGHELKIDPPGKRLNQILASQGVNPPNVEEQVYPPLSEGERRQEAFSNWAQNSADNQVENPQQGDLTQRVNGAPINSAEAQGIRQWGEQNLAQRLPQQAMGTVNNMPGANAARLGAVEGAAAGQLGGAAAAGGAAVGGMSRAATFATRALPVLNLALLAGSLVQASNQNRRQKQSEEQYNRMRV